MSSNFSNYFHKAYTQKQNFDELVYGFNGTSGSKRMDSSKQAVGYVEMTSTSYTRATGGLTTLNMKGFSITGSYDGTSTLKKSEVKIEFNASYTDGQYFISSSNEAWLRLNAGVTNISRDSLIEYLANVINIHRTSTVNAGPPIIASRSGSFLILAQEYPGSAGNECGVQNLPSPNNLPAGFEFENFAEGNSAGGGPYSISWAPITGAMTTTGISIVSSYVLSPVHHGQLVDVFYTPPEHFAYGPRETPLVKSSFTGSIIISSNRDEHSRIFARYQDGDASANYALAVDPTYTSLS